MPIVLIGLAACGERNVDDELRSFVEDVVAATEARDTGHFREIVGASYVDFRGNDRSRAIDLVRGFFLANSSIAAQATIIDVGTSGTESARIVLDTRIDGNMGVLSGQLELELLRDGSAWTIIGARWQDEARRRL